MKKMSTFYIVFASIFLLFACEEKEETTPISDKFGETITLKIGESVEVNGADLIIGFDKVVDDSRCPTGAECFWEGQAEVNLLLNKTKEVLVIMRAGQEDLAKDTLDNIVVTLLDVRPYPDVKGELPIPTEEYSIDIQVDEL